MPSLRLRCRYLDSVRTMLTTFYHTNHYAVTGHVVKFSYNNNIITSGGGKGGLLHSPLLHDCYIQDPTKVGDNCMYTTRRVVLPVMNIIIPVALLLLRMEGHRTECQFNCNCILAKQLGSPFTKHSIEHSILLEHMAKSINCPKSRQLALDLGPFITLEYARSRSLPPP